MFLLEQKSPAPLPTCITGMEAGEIQLAVIISTQGKDRSYQLW
jgi:hypothetical protein